MELNSGHFLLGDGHINFVKLVSNSYCLISQGTIVDILSFPLCIPLSYSMHVYSRTRIVRAEWRQYANFSFTDLSVYIALFCKWCIIVCRHCRIKALKCGLSFHFFVIFSMRTLILDSCGWCSMLESSLYLLVMPIQDTISQSWIKGTIY